MTDRRVVIEPIGPPERAAAVAAHAARRGLPRCGPTDAEIPRRSDGYVDAEGRHVPLVEADGPSDLPALVDRLRAGAPVAVRWHHERVIPLETLVAARRAPGTLWVVADRPEDVPGALGALEHGADVVVARIGEPEGIDRLEEILDRPRIAPAWSQATVRTVRTSGMGDRILVDTTSLLRDDEGILVGSQAARLLLVLSEAVGSRFTRPRPFRVNAGAAHLYVLLSSGETRYLSELEAGDSVLACRAGGTGLRSVRVGRVKVERRPLTLIEAEEGGHRFTAFLQEAETVRLATEAGPAAVTALAPGAVVPFARLPAGRHLGVAVEETIDER
ncbi:MAG: 3-dehydroquinate synthase II [Thermoplasmata archaeon]